MNNSRTRVVRTWVGKMTLNLSTVAVETNNVSNSNAILEDFVAYYMRAGCGVRARIGRFSRLRRGRPRYRSAADDAVAGGCAAFWRTTTLGHRVRLRRSVPYFAELILGTAFNTYHHASSSCKSIVEKTQNAFGLAALPLDVRKGWAFRLQASSLQNSGRRPEFCPPLARGTTGGVVLTVLTNEDPLPQKTRRSFLKASIPLEKGDKCRNCRESRRLSAHLAAEPLKT